MQSKIKTKMDVVEKEDTPQELLYEVVCTYKDTINHAVSSRFGLKAWFKGFLQTEEFHELDNEGKAKAFEAYDELFYVLDEIDSIKLPQL